MLLRNYLKGTKNGVKDSLEPVSPNFIIILHEENKKWNFLDESQTLRWF